MPSRLMTLRGRVLSSVSAAASRIGIPLARSADPVETVLAAFARATAARGVTFVQIGSNDGTTSDPLRGLTETYGWAGVLVEPVPYVFSRLRQVRGSDPHIRLENAAITDHDGLAEFFHLRQRRAGEQLPEWYDQVGSFSRQTVLSHETGIPGVRDLLVTTTVKALTFDSLCAKHRIDEFDLLHIDTEGYDWQILRRIDLERYRPAMVIYEHAHLTPVDRRAAQTRLRTCGYAWHEATYDTIGVQYEELRGDAGLERAWRQVTGRDTAR